MYRLQHMNVIATTDDDAKKAVLLKQGYTLLEDTAVAASADKTTDADTKAAADAKK